MSRSTLRTTPTTRQSSSFYGRASRQSSTNHCRTALANPSREQRPQGPLHKRSPPMTRQTQGQSPRGYHGAYRVGEGLLDRSDIYQQIVSDEEEEPGVFESDLDRINSGLHPHDQLVTPARSTNTASSLWSSPLTSSSGYNSQREQTIDENIDSDYHSELRTMIQQQQGMLLQIMSQQESFIEKQQLFEERLIAVEEQVLSIQQQSSPEEASDSAGSKEKFQRTWKRDLTTKVSSIHDKLEEGFNASESSKSRHNSAVKQTILMQIVQADNHREAQDRYSESIVKAAVQRKYETVRRKWLAEGKENFEEANKLLHTKKKYRARRQRKFENRKCVLFDSERKYWEDLTLDYMTEESDDETDPTRITVHKLPWRSKELNDFFVKLDGRYEKKVAKEGGTVARKVRTIGDPSSLGPPLGAPTWTVDANFQSPSADTVPETAMEDSH